MDRAVLRSGRCLQQTANVTDHDAPMDVTDTRLEYLWLSAIDAEPSQRAGGGSPYDFGNVRAATVALLTLTALSEWRSCGVAIAKFSDHAVSSEEH